MPVGLQHEHLPNGIEILRLDRPAQRNALNLGLIGALVDALGHLGADPDLRAIVLSTTSTDAFCAGADVNEPLTAGQGVARMDAFAALYAAIEAVPAPTIAVCLGHCVGAGAELAVGCDLRVIADNVASPGLEPASACRWARPGSLPWSALSRAKELIFTGRSIDQAEAVALGLAARTATVTDAETVALALAEELGRQSSPGLRELKRMFADFEAAPARVARENAILTRWQRRGPGLPAGPPADDA